MSEIPANVDTVFATYPEPARAKALEIRAMIYDIAAIENVGPLQETLKWGQPAYLTRPKIGSTVRLGWSAKTPDKVSVYFICTTHLVDRFREIYPDTFDLEKGRAMHFNALAQLPQKALGHCLAMALTYHRNK